MGADPTRSRAGSKPAQPFEFLHPAEDLGLGGPGGDVQPETLTAERGDDAAVQDGFFL